MHTARYKFLMKPKESADLVFSRAVLGCCGVAPTSVPIRNGIEGVACAQTSIQFR